MSLYDLIWQKAKEIGWPTSFRDDLEVHDRHTLQGLQKGDWFVWSVCSTGTWLFTCRSRSAFFIARYTIHTQPESRWFHYNGKELLEITPQQALDLLEPEEENDHPGYAA